MSALTTTAVLVGLLGTALIGGVFFAFSSFVMKALARVPSAEGIAAMQSINVVVLNPSFLGAFMGTAVLSIGIALLAIKGWGTPSTAYYLAGALASIAFGLSRASLSARLTTAPVLATCCATGSSARAASSLGRIVSERSSSAVRRTTSGGGPPSGGGWTGPGPLGSALGRAEHAEVVAVGILEVG